MRSSAFWKLVAASLNCLAFIWVLPSSMNSDVTGFTRVACVNASIACTHVTRWHQKTHTNTQTQSTTSTNAWDCERSCHTRAGRGQHSSSFLPRLSTDKKTAKPKDSLPCRSSSGRTGRPLAGWVAHRRHCLHLPARPFQKRACRERVFILVSLLFPSHSPRFSVHMFRLYMFIHYFCITVNKHHSKQVK